MLVWNVKFCIHFTTVKPEHRDILLHNTWSVSILHSWYFRVSPLHCCAFFSASWMICILYTQKIICIFYLYVFSMAVIFDHKQQKCDYFLTTIYLFRIKSIYIYFFFSWSHSDCHKSHWVSYHSNKVVIFKMYFSCLKWPNNTRGLSTFKFF